MQGDLAAAAAVLERAPTFKALDGDAHGGGMAYANARNEQWARIRLAEGRPDAALAVLPPPYGFPAAEDRSDPTLAPHALRGEVLCAAGQPAQGLPYLQASIAAIAPELHPSSPALARLRAVAGLCALALRDDAGARQFAVQARAALVAQPQVSAWYGLPVAQLEHALKVRSPR